MSLGFFRLWARETFDNPADKPQLSASDYREQDDKKDKRHERSNIGDLKAVSDAEKDPAEKSRHKPKQDEHFASFAQTAAAFVYRHG
jgi:hypothetical protein